LGLVSNHCSDRTLPRPSRYEDSCRDGPTTWFFAGIHASAVWTPGLRPGPRDFLRHGLRCSKGARKSPEATGPRGRRLGRTVGLAIPCPVASPRSRTPFRQASRLYRRTNGRCQGRLDELRHEPPPRTSMEMDRYASVVSHHGFGAAFVAATMNSVRCRHSPATPTQLDTDGHQGFSGARKSQGPERFLHGSPHAP
jgi:hypothetical protein